MAIIANSYDLRSKLVLSGHRAAENAEIANGRWRFNRMDVNICRKLEVSAKNWYFIGNYSSIAGPK
jgi:hypothetical protein